MTNALTISLVAGLLATSANAAIVPPSGAVLSGAAAMATDRPLGAPHLGWQKASDDGWRDRDNNRGWYSDDDDDDGRGWGSDDDDDDDRGWGGEDGGFGGDGDGDSDGDGDD